MKPDATLALCNGRARYRDEAKAERALRASYQADPGWELVTVACPDCGGWHVTQRPIARQRPSVDAIKAMCASKKRYPTERLAYKVLHKCEAERGQALRVYACPICGLYHLTSAAANWWEDQ